MNKTKQPMSYKSAGVDIDSGDDLVNAFKPMAKSTFRDGCLSDVGGFGALFEVPGHINNPVLVSSTDGVGTKVKLAFDFDQHDTIGIDLVAMCVNDVLVQGAEPLFFLDYFATGELNPTQTIDVVRGIAEGCRQAGTALIGGETAEMPGMYSRGEYDLAGFCVGIVERANILDGRDIKTGDMVLGVASSGLHANGYSLIRHVIDTCDVDLSIDLEGIPLTSVLLEPTRIYVKPVLSLLKEVPVHGMAHITGGGLPGNLKRVLSETYQAHIRADAWTWPRIFSWLQETGGIETPEMYRTFNCGIGLAIVLAETHVDRAIECLKLAGEETFVIGKILPRDGDTQVQIT
ncbi:MAG: phosphoribosylformylglycinamidine cyclo-ligase [Arenicellales bacterium]|nr:phosphoribosylformylglycinamidine cyclo-ligase [Arenicellales bacterium]